MDITIGVPYIRLTPPHCNKLNVSYHEKRGWGFDALLTVSFWAREKKKVNNLSFKALREERER